jgi:hypothetical protein
MPIDPEAKMARVRAEAAAKAQRKANARTAKPLTADIVETVETAIATRKRRDVVDVLADKALASLADTSAEGVRQARRKLQSRASEYVDLHLQACKVALREGEPGEARKGAEAMIDRITALAADGTVERIVDKPAAISELPRIQIGIALGGLPPKPSN